MKEENITTKHQEIEDVLNKDKFKRVKYNLSRILAISAIYTLFAVTQNEIIAPADIIDVSSVEAILTNDFESPVVSINSTIDEEKFNNSVIIGNESPRYVKYNTSRLTTLDEITAFKEIELLPTGSNLFLKSTETELTPPKLTLKAQTAPPPWEPSDEFETHVDVQVEPPKYIKEIREKTIYLTFDDGPSDVTIDILDTLAEFGIKGTFFVTCQSPVQTSEKYIDVLKRIVDEGHTIAVHTYSHEYSIYQSLETFLDDFSLIFNHIIDATGVTPDIFRFAGGSRNSFNRHNADEIINEMNNRGFVFYDWNVSNDDSIGKIQTEEDLINNVKNTFNYTNQEIILMHDLANKQNTAAALDDIIMFGIENGYKFDKLTNEVPPIQF